MGVVGPVLCRQGAVLVAAFHPELTADRRIHRLFVSMIEDRDGEAPEAEQGSGRRPAARGVVAGASEGQGR